MTDRLGGIKQREGTTDWKSEGNTWGIDRLEDRGKNGEWQWRQGSNNEELWRVMKQECKWDKEIGSDLHNRDCCWFLWRVDQVGADLIDRAEWRALNLHISTLSDYTLTDFTSLQLATFYTLDIEVIFRCNWGRTDRYLLANIYILLLWKCCCGECWEKNEGDPENWNEIEEWLASASHLPTLLIVRLAEINIWRILVKLIPHPGGYPYPHSVLSFDEY